MERVDHSAEAMRLMDAALLQNEQAMEELRQRYERGEIVGHAALEEVEYEVLHDES